MESKLVEAQQHIKRSKDRQLRETVKFISSSLFLLVVVTLLVGMYRMFSPHFDSIIMAGLVALLIKGDPQRGVHEKLLFYKNRIRGMNRMAVVSCNVLLFALSCTPLVGYQVQIMVALLFGLEAAIFFVEISTLVPAIITISVSAGLCIPLFLVLKSSAVEVDAFVKLSMRILEDKDQLQSLANQVSNGPAKLLIPLLESLGVSSLNLGVIGEKIKALGAANSALALDLVANLSNLVWMCGIFASTLFWLLQLDIGSVWDTTLGNLSPLLPQDNIDIHYTVRQGSLEVFLGSALVGLVHGMVTIMTLTSVGSPLVIVPAFFSCLLAVAPILGSFVIWLPFAVGLFALDRVMAACVMAIVELLTMLIVEPWLVSRFPTSGKFFGYPIVCGLFAFGPCGLVYGPLVIGLSITTAKIFLRYVSSSRTTDEDYDFQEDFLPEDEEGEIGTMNQSGYSYMHAMHQSPDHRMSCKSPAISGSVLRSPRKSPRKSVHRDWKEGASFQQAC